MVSPKSVFSLDLNDINLYVDCVSIKQAASTSKIHEQAKGFICLLAKKEILNEAL